MTLPREKASKLGSHNRMISNIMLRSNAVARYIPFYVMIYLLSCIEAEA